MEGLDVLILEDSNITDIYKVQFDHDLTNLKYKITESTQEFRNAASSNRVKVAFLDDQVPNEEGSIKPQFINNSKFLMEKNYGSRIFYIGNTPSSDIISYCREKDIDIIQKAEVFKNIKLLIKENTV